MRPLWSPTKQVISSTEIGLEILWVPFPAPDPILPDPGPTASNFLSFKGRPPPSLQQHRGGNLVVPSVA
jgi:hypothetical protein